MRKQKKTQILERVKVDNYAAEGKSLARVDGKVVFIEGTVPGDVVDVQLYKNKKDWAEGFPIHFHEYSSQRVTPFCSHFGSCGGCQWQTVPYEEQLRFKQQQVEDHLSRIAKVPLPTINPILGAEQHKYYRNKMEYTFANKRFIPEQQFRELKAKGESTNMWMNVGGFHAKGIFDKVVEIDTCHLQAEPSNAIRQFIVEYGRKNELSFYDIRMHQGFLRNVMVRIATTGEVMVNVILGYEDPTLREPLLAALMQAFPQITTLLFTINTKFNDSIFDLHPIAFHGPGYILENLEEFQFKISPKSFFQTNTRQGEQLYRVTRDFAELNGCQHLYDLYCGTGSIGIFCSKQVKSLVGVELIEQAIEDAKENARINKIEAAHFTAGDVIQVCNDAFFEVHGRPDVVITDPPRAGMHEKLVQKLLDIAAPLVVYVSCNPATQARDLQALGEKYSVEKIQPVDMFPQTHHIENVVQLKLKTG